MVSQRQTGEYAKILKIIKRTLPFRAFFIVEMVELPKIVLRIYYKLEEALNSIILKPKRDNEKNIYSCISFLEL